MLTDVKVIAKRLMVKRGEGFKIVFLHWLEGIVNHEQRHYYTGFDASV